MSGHLASREFANFLLQAPVGLSLVDELRAGFPAIRREDVFLGIAFAWSALQADLLIAQIELQEVERRMKMGTPA
jgi:hypothetical protein